jgi:alkylation response protein AidB-like acyl-CoA dehydrogenase
MTDLLSRAEDLAQRFEARAAGYDEAAAFPEQDLGDLRAEGFLGIMVPARLGGVGAGFEDYVRVAATLATGSASTALIFNMHASVTGALSQISDEMATALGAAPSFTDTRDQVLRRAGEGAAYGVAITERGAGSRLSALTTTYDRDGDGYRIRGTKAFCSGAGRLDAYLVAARRAGSEKEPVISYFLVPNDAGLEVEEDWNPLGMRATASHTVHVDARVTGEALLGGIEGLVLPLADAMPQWLVASYAAVYVGVARSAVSHATAYLRQRTVAGERGGLSRVAHVRQRVGRADAAVRAAELAVDHAAHLVDLRPGDPETNRWVYRAKLLAGDTAMTVGASMAEACGAGALRRGSALERIFRDARAGALMPPASDVAGDYLGSSILGVEGERPW